MNVDEAYFKWKDINNKINELLDEKEKLLVLVEPKVVDLQKEKVFSSKIVDRFEAYYYENEQLDLFLDFLYQIANLFKNYIEKELKRLKKYNEVQDLIIFYRNMGLQWAEISNKVNCPNSTCRYKKI